LEYDKKDLTELTTLESLEELQLFNSKIENFKGIEKLGNLRKVNIDGARKLESLNGFSKSQSNSMEWLRLWSVRNLYDASAISNLKNLDFLQIAKVNNLKSLSFLNKLKNLSVCNIHKSMVKVEDGDYSLIDKFK